MKRNGFFSALIGVCSSLTFTTAALASDYQTLFPKYAEVCALSQKAKIGEEAERPWGHSLVFLRGVCRDLMSPIPQLVLCEPTAGSGVMVSVNSLTKNVNWIASEGEAYAFYGNVFPGTKLTTVEYDQAVQYGLMTDIFKGVKPHFDQFKPGQLEKYQVNEALVRSAVDIDTAVTFGRDAYCARVPMNEQVLGDLIHWLNEKNQAFARTEDYQWDAFKNNCAHLVHNAFASLGVWPAKQTGTPPWQVSNLAVPANEFIDTMAVANLTDISDPTGIFRNPGWRRLLVEKNWLPARHGVVSRNLPIQTPNELYYGNLQIFVFDYPFSNKNEALFHAFTQSSTYQDLAANLLRFHEIYSKSLQNLQDVSAYQATLKDLPMSEQAQFPAFFVRYKDYLKEQLDDVTFKLSSFQLVSPLSQPTR